MDALTDRTVLIVEDGDEYLESMTNFVPGPRYVQARSASAALGVLDSDAAGSDALGGDAVDLIYLDMRFDRIPRADLVGDHAAATRARNGDPQRGWRFLQNNQGLYILDALGKAGYDRLPTLISYDFSREPSRWRRLASRYPRLVWVSDAIGPEDIRAIMLRLVG